MKVKWLNLKTQFKKYKTLLILPSTKLLACTAVICCTLTEDIAAFSGEFNGQMYILCKGRIHIPCYCLNLKPRNVRKYDFRELIFISLLLSAYFLQLHESIFTVKVPECVT